MKFQEMQMVLLLWPTSILYQPLPPKKNQNKMLKTQSST